MEAGGQCATAKPLHYEPNADERSQALTASYARWQVRGQVKAAVGVRGQAQAKTA